MQQRLTIDISTRSVLKVIGVLLGIWFLFLIRNIVLLLFIVIIIVMALTPIVDRWQKRMPRALAVGLLFLIIMGVFSLIISLLIPPLVTQVGELAMNLPQYASTVQDYLGRLNSTHVISNDIFNQAIDSLSSQLSQLSRSLLQVTFGVLGGFFTFLTIAVLSAYLLFEEQGIRNFLLSLLPIEHKGSVINAVNKVGDKLGAWLRGQLLLMIVIGVSTFVWITILGLPYALTLGLWAGLTEVIPFIGPVIGGIPIIIIAFLDSPIKAVIALIILVVVQQVESTFLVPKIMQRAVGLSPVIVIIALMIGGQLFGITGTILSIPLAAALAVGIQEWPKISKAIFREKKYN